MSQGLSRRRTSILAGAALLVVAALGGGAIWWADRGGQARRLARSDDPSQRLQAVHELWGRRSGWAVDILARLSEDPHPPVAVQAVRAIGEAGTPAAEEALRRVVRPDARPSVRGAAAAALGRYQTAFDLLLGLLADPQAEVRAGAAKGLVMVPRQQALEPLLRAMDDEDQDVRLWAATAVRGVVRMPVDFRAEAPPEVRRKQIDALRATLKSLAEAEANPSENRRRP